MKTRFIDHRDQVIADRDDDIRKALEMIGLQMEGYAKESLTASGAVDTGRLRNSITYATEDYNGQGTYSDNKGNSYSDAYALAQPKKNLVAVGTNVEYGPYIEFGTSKMTPRP